MALHERCSVTYDQQIQITLRRVRGSSHGSNEDHGDRRSLVRRAHCLHEFLRKCRVSRYQHRLRPFKTGYEFIDFVEKAFKIRNKILEIDF